MANRSDFPEKLPLEKTQFCFSCKQPDIEPVHKNEPRFFYCSKCQKTSERYLVWDPNMLQYFNPDDQLVHESVGVLVHNQQGEVLLFKRTKFPFLWTIPAGHLEINELPETAAIRELLEETGINAVNINLLFAEEIKNEG